MVVNSSIRRAGGFAGGRTGEGGGMEGISMIWRFLSRPKRKSKSGARKLSAAAAGAYRPEEK